MEKSKPMMKSFNCCFRLPYKKIAAKIFDPAVFNGMEGNSGEIIRTSENPPLRTTNDELFKELYAPNLAGF